VTSRRAVIKESGAGITTSGAPAKQPPDPLE
jgi:hypothetical protein